MTYLLMATQKVLVPWSYLFRQNSTNLTYGKCIFICLHLFVIHVYLQRIKALDSNNNLARFRQHNSVVDRLSILSRLFALLKKLKRVANAPLQYFIQKRDTFQDTVHPNKNAPALFLYYRLKDIQTWNSRQGLKPSLAERCVKTDDLQNLCLQTPPKKHVYHANIRLYQVLHIFLAYFQVTI